MLYLLAGFAGWPVSQSVSRITLEAGNLDARNLSKASASTSPRRMPNCCCFVACCRFSIRRTSHCFFALHRQLVVLAAYSWIRWSTRFLICSPSCSRLLKLHRYSRDSILHSTGQANSSLSGSDTRTWWLNDSAQHSKFHSRHYASDQQLLGGSRFVWVQQDPAALQCGTAWTAVSHHVIAKALTTHTVEYSSLPVISGWQG